MKNKIWLVPIEPIENRYTSHWFDFVPSQMRNAGFEVGQIVPHGITANVANFDTNAGAFFNFADTVKWKAEQLVYATSLFKDKKIKEDDIFLFTDAWNPMAHMIRYLSSLVGPRVRIVGIWHAGSYDQNDILGQKFNKNWSLDEEVAMSKVYDMNLFATEYHRNLWQHNLNVKDARTAVVGFPMEYYDRADIIRLPTKQEYLNRKKLVVFPHRKSPEKMLEAFEYVRRIVQERVEGVEFVVAQDVCKNKTEYHRLLKEASVVFSANLQETLGIGTYEGLRSGCSIVVPNRLSYKEMYPHLPPLIYRYNEFEWDAPSNPSSFGTNRYTPEYGGILESVEAVQRALTEPRLDYETFLDIERRVYSKFFTGHELYAVLNNFRGRYDFNRL